MTLHLCDRNPTVAPETLIAEMVPPSTFDDVSFDTYIPSPSEPSQTAALAAARSFADRARQVRGGKHGFFGRRHAPKQGIGLYLDGGFCVGKTHLLASIYHAMPGPKAFATFVELTQLVGALGFINTVGAERGSWLTAGNAAVGGSSAAGASALLAAGALAPPLKSVAYHPDPLSWNPAAVNCLENDGLPQAGQSVNGASDIFCRTSLLCPQDSHL